MTLIGNPKRKVGVVCRLCLLVLKHGIASCTLAVAHKLKERLKTSLRLRKTGPNVNTRHSSSGGAKKGSSVLALAVIVNTFLGIHLGKRGPQQAFTGAGIQRAALRVGKDFFLLLLLEVAVYV
eukprot:scaffold109_cov252-Pinguiococcus_pyrenoidosus.AAC.108